MIGGHCDINRIEDIKIQNIFLNYYVYNDVFCDLGETT